MDFKESFDVDDSFILIPRPTVSKFFFFQPKTTESRDLGLGPDLVSDTNRMVMKHTKLTFLPEIHTTFGELTEPEVYETTGNLHTPD